MRLRPILLASLLLACGADPTADASVDAGPRRDASGEDGGPGLDAPACSPGDPGCAPCAEGPIGAAGCVCDGLRRTSGHCCAGAWVATECGGSTVTDLVPASRITRWQPGIQSDEQLHLPLDARGLPTRTTVCATLSPGDDVQAAIDACPEGQVVVLDEGTFRLSATLRIDRGVVVRGAGSVGGGHPRTILERTGGGIAIRIGRVDDSGTCDGGAAFDLLEDAPLGSTTVRLSPTDAARLSAGDLVTVDQRDDPAVVDAGDCAWFHRDPARALGQRVEIAAVDAASGTVTLSSPLHWTFETRWDAQLAEVDQTITRYAGLEGVLVRGGSSRHFAGGIDVWNAASSWIADVETDGTIDGEHIVLSGTYRFVVRDSYVHHSATYGFGEDCYGIVLRFQAADDLIENNVARWMNKPILFNASGGGNVIAYNYADNSWSTPPAWQEVNIDTHCAFPHMELMEGNDAPHMGATTTHGNAGYLTYFRNHASSVFAPPAVVGSSGGQDGNVAALQFMGGDVGMNVLGNVLGAAGVSTEYDAEGPGSAAIYQLGLEGAGLSDVAATTLLRHGNWDAVNATTMWDPAIAEHDLPASFYLAARPGWWPAELRWPWVGPDLDPMVGVLPARARAELLSP